MSDHTVMRRRLAAVDEAIRVLCEEWQATDGGGPVPLLGYRVTGDAAKAAEQDERGGCYLNVVGVVLVLQEIRGSLFDMTQVTERYAMAHGPQDDWESI